MTDADVDGSHIRTLLLTFFYRQMRELVERGHIYIAQPPLYRAKQGREEVYLKDEHELKQHLLKVALKGAELVPAAGAQALAVDTLSSVAREYLLAEAVVERMSRVVDPAVLYALLAGAKVDLSTETAANRSASALAEAVADPEVTVVARYDAASESRRLVIVRVTTARRTRPCSTPISSSGDGAQIASAAAVLRA
jgi:DNA gyrase subunit B